MATFDYAGIRDNVANKLIDKFGQPGTIRAPGAKTGDKWNPTIGAPTTEACVLVELEYTQSEIDGTLILAKDKKVLVKVGGLTKEFMVNATELIYGGVTHIVVQPVKPLSPGGVLLLWELQVRV